MTPCPLASLHLGLSAEAMLLLDPQLHDRTRLCRSGPSQLVSVILYLGLLLLVSGTAIALDHRFPDLF